MIAQKTGRFGEFFLWTACAIGGAVIASAVAVGMGMPRAAASAAGRGRDRQPRLAAASPQPAGVPHSWRQSWSWRRICAASASGLACAVAEPLGAPLPLGWAPTWAAGFPSDSGAASGSTAAQASREAKAAHILGQNRDCRQECGAAAGCEDAAASRGCPSSIPSPPRRRSSLRHRYSHRHRRRIDGAADSRSGPEKIRQTGRHAIMPRAFTAWDGMSWTIRPVSGTMSDYLKELMRRY